MTRFLGVVAAAIGAQSGALSDDMGRNEGFRNGVVFGRAIEALSTTPVYIKLFEEITYGDSKASVQKVYDVGGPRQRILWQMVENAAAINGAIELPDSVVPTKEPLKKALRLISDHLHQHAPEALDATLFEQHSAEVMRNLKRLRNLDDNALRQQQAWKERTRKVIVILAKYHSEPRSPEPQSQR